MGVRSKKVYICEQDTCLNIDPNKFEIVDNCAYCEVCKYAARAILIDTKAVAPLWTVGFSGTREGMTGPQLNTFERMTREFQTFECEFRHGDCVGSDAQAHFIATSLKMRIVIHPPENESLRAFCKGAFSVLPPAKYLERNFAIVDKSDRFFATPNNFTYMHGSGTWSSIHMARAQFIPMTIIFPDGTYRDEFPLGGTYGWHKNKGIKEKYHGG